MYQSHQFQKKTLDQAVLLPLRKRKITFSEIAEKHLSTSLTLEYQRCNVQKVLYYGHNLACVLIKADSSQQISGFVVVKCVTFISLSLQATRWAV
jgi:hypothetical protein